MNQPNRPSGCNEEDLVGEDGWEGEGGVGDDKFHSVMSSQLKHMAMHAPVIHRYARSIPGPRNKKGSTVAHDASKCEGMLACFPGTSRRSQYPVVPTHDATLPPRQPRCAPNVP